MPPEWARHRGTWLSWPHRESSWPGRFEPVPARFAEIVRHLAPREEVHILAGAVRVRTRCLDADHDKACGNEIAFYPPLAGGVDVRPAAAVESSYSGPGLRETWRDCDRRGAYVGSFSVQ